MSQHHPPGVPPGIAILVATLLGFALHALRAHRRHELELGRALLAARTDPLTGLPNRTVASEHLTRSDVRLLVLLDLDGFKQVNDNHGHHVGDRVLAIIAARLDETAGASGGFAARLAGDEFLLWWENSPTSCGDGHHDDQRAADLLTRVLTVIAARVDVDGLRLQVGISAGLVLAGEHLHGPALLRAADAAMYQAKRSDPTGAAPEPCHGRVRVRSWDDDRPPAPTDRRARRDTGPATSPTSTATDMTSTSTSGALRVVKEGTR